MIRIAKIIFLVLLFFDSYGQDSKYYQEEYKVLNDIFLDIADTSHYIHSGLGTLYPIEDTYEYMQDTSLYDVLEYMFPIEYYEPFDMLKGLISTNGDSLLIQELYKGYNDYKDSITGLPDLRELIIHTSDSLFSIRKSRVNYQNTIQGFLKIGKLDTFRYDTLETRYFNYKGLNNTGRFTFSDQPYPELSERMETKEIKEVYSISISRVIFNADFSRGILFCSYFRDYLDANGVLILIKKKKGKWIIHKSMITWIS